MNDYFPPWNVMVAVDLLLLALAVAGTAVVGMKWKPLKLARALFGIFLILSGLWFVAGLYMADLYAMMILPTNVGMEKAMRVMNDLHLRYSWYLNTASAAFVLVGLAIVVVRLTDQLCIVDEALRVAEEQSRQKTNFLAAMSHELRTPLNAIIGFAQMLRILSPADIRDRIREYSENIESSGLLLNNLVNELLDMSRIESGNFKLNLVEIDVCEVVSTAVRRLEGMAHKIGVEITPEMNAPVACCIADERAVEQIALNLLSNALKHTGSGGNVRVSVSNPEAGTVRLAVVDNGAGIAPDQLPHVFEPFVYTDPMTEAGASHGLGLPICKKLVEAHNGRIVIESTLGVGTAVRVDLPAGSTPTEEPRAQAA